MNRLSEERGLTLIELLVSSLISMLVLGATLTVFESIATQRARIEAQTEVESSARQSVDRLARQLRNLASPADVVTNVQASTQPKSVDRDTPTDLIFKDVADTRPAGSVNSANVRRVRYCLQSSGPVAGSAFTASPTRQVLWMQTQTWTTAAPPATPTDTVCPGSAWPTRQIVADHVVNTTAVPLFTYSGDTGLVTGTTDADRERISRVTTTLRLDADATRGPDATELTTSVILRNQNRAPVAKFLYTLLIVNSASCSIQLNGSMSEDPESKPLEYAWEIDGDMQPETGVIVQKSVTRGSHTYLLRVYDRARLVGTSAQESYAC